MAQLGANDQNLEQGYGKTPDVQQRFDDTQTTPTDASQDSGFEKPSEDLDSSSGNQSVTSQSGIEQTGDESGKGGASQRDQLGSEQGNDGLETSYDESPSSQVDTNPGNRAQESTPSAGEADGFQPGRESYGEQQRSYGTVDPNTDSSEADIGSSGPGRSVPAVPDRAQQHTSAQQGGFPVPTRPPGAVVPSDNQFSGPRQREDETGRPSQTTASQKQNYGESAPEYNQQTGEGGPPAQTRDSQSSTYQQQSEPGNTGYGDVPSGVDGQSNDAATDYGNVPSGVDGQSNDADTGYGDVPSGVDGQSNDADTGYGDVPSGVDGQSNNADTGYGDVPSGVDGQSYDANTGYGDVPSGVDGQSKDADTSYGDVPSGVDGQSNDADTGYGDVPSGVDGQSNDAENRTENTPQGQSHNVLSYTQDPSVQNVDTVDQGDSSKVAPVSEDTTGGTAVDETPEKGGFLTKLKHMWPGKQNDVEAVNSPPTANPDGDGKPPGLATRLKEKLTHGKNKDENVDSIQ